MRATLKKLTDWAEANQCAVGAFNTPTYENVVAVISAAERLNVPVIISHAQLHEPEAPIDRIGPLMAWAADRAKVPVCVFLDHGETIDYVKHSVELGFTGVMYDASLAPYADNVAGTGEIVAFAHERGVQVEAEIGALAQREGGGDSGGSAVYTDPELALRFVKDTGIDALAASFGTAHGIYKVKPKLDFDRIRRIRELTGLPLVMHGGSGVSPEDYRTAIGCGIRKINYYSYMARAGRNAVADKLADESVTFFHVLAAAATEAMSADAEKAMRVFCGK